MSQEYHVLRPILPNGVRLIENVYIPMRDGVKLAVDVYLPEAEGRYPVILSLSPYKKEAQPGSPIKGYHAEAGEPSFYIPYGYAMVHAQVRGSGMSQGQYNFYDKTEQKDGYDLVEAIAQQSWCDGNVGMLGGSYLAMSQYYTAAQQPPHLKCIVPCDGMTDVYRGFAYPGGLFFSGFSAGWTVMVTMDCVWPGPVEGKLPPAAILADWYRNYEDVPYWQERRAIDFLDKIKAPVLYIVAGTGFLHSTSQLHGWPEIKSTKKMLIMFTVPGPFAAVFRHNEPANEYVRRWFDYWLKGIDTGIMEEPPVAIYDTGTNQWRYENEYPIARTKWTKYYLRSNSKGTATAPPWGLISTEPPVKGEEPEQFKAPRPRPELMANMPVLGYVSDPLDNDVRVQGPLSFTCYGSSKTEDATPLAWFVRVGDIAPDDNTKMLTFGQLKASFREINDTMSKPGQPFRPFQKPVQVKPGEVNEYQIELVPTFHTFKKGHKIWVQIASDDPNFELTNAGDLVCGPVPAENAIYHDSEHPSHLLLPVIPDAPEIAPVKPPISEIKLPSKVDIGSAAARGPLG